MLPSSLARDVAATPPSVVRLVWAWRWRALLLALALAGAGWLAVPMVLGPPVAVVTARRGALVQSVVATGRVETPHRANIASQITGAVAEIPVAQGQHVHAGQVLVVLEDAELRANLAQAESAALLAETKRRQMTEMTLPMLGETLAQADATLLNAEQQFARTNTLAQAGHETLAQRDNAQKILDIARAQQRAARYQVASSSPGGSDFTIAENSLAQARAAVAIARARLGYARIAAPADGVLIARNVEPGWVVGPNQTLMVLSPDGETQVVVQVDEKNLRRLVLGQRALVSADAYPDRSFPAELIYINPSVDPQRAAVEVKLRVPDPPEYLRQDMTVSVDVAVAERADALVLPITAVHDPAEARPFVLLAEDGRARRRDVRIGLLGASQVEILAGVPEGALVVPVAAPVADGGRLRAQGAGP